ncbi:hypothetical protein KGF57_000920 [Candida theae]|uniref:Mediator of RNA polymerase II transcription subunit 9 n=1 Tax=Candida theae TaxID=1198502 RepID=A0AAD5G0A4_9ASCO|nr:uncharacterized protein KGF57_000920 [Candida theae]KAI5965127.1 hypothetical protein KGF57_000920 [Candida theae]
MDTPIGLEGTIDSDYSLENRDDITHFRQLDSVGDSDHGSTTEHLPDPRSSSVQPELANVATSTTGTNQEGQITTRDDKSHSDAQNGTNQVDHSLLEIDKMDIDTPREQVNTSRTATEPEPVDTGSPHNNTTLATPNDQSDDALAKIKQIQLLPELYDILFNFTNGQIHPRDFDKHIGNMRSKLNNLKSYISEIDDIEVTPESMMSEINRLRENNLKKQSLLESFGDKVRNEFM